jgi:hypothetical protein
VTSGRPPQISIQDRGIVIVVEYVTVASRNCRVRCQTTSAKAHVSTHETTRSWKYHNLSASATSMCLINPSIISTMCYRSPRKAVLQAEPLAIWFPRGTRHCTVRYVRVARNNANRR